MFCQNCGKEVNDKAVVCVGCGCAIGKKQLKQGKMSGWIIASICLLGFTILSNLGTAISYGIDVFYTLGTLLPVILALIFIVVDYYKKNTVANKPPKQENEFNSNDNATQTNSFNEDECGNKPTAINRDLILASISAVILLALTVFVVLKLFQ